MAAIDDLPYDATGPLAFRVLTKLANVSAQDGTRAWRLNSEMSNELGVSVRSIQRALRELEEGHLIRRGDQRAVSHWRTDRRPTVYDVVMNHGIATITPLDDGVTEISTGEDGVTNEATTAVVPKELRELTTTKTSRSNQTGRVAPCSATRSGTHSIDPISRYCLACGLREDQL